MTIEEKQREFLDKFNTYEDEFDKYGYVIFLGSQLEVMPEEWITDENLYAGCLSKIWIHGEVQSGKIVLYADSDTLIVKGLLYVVKELLQGRTVEEARNAKITLFDDLDMESVLNETRRKGMNGLISWILDDLALPVTVMIQDSGDKKTKAENGKKETEDSFLRELIEKELDCALTLLGYQVMDAEACKNRKGSCIFVRIREDMAKEKDSFHVLVKPVKNGSGEVHQLSEKTDGKEFSHIVLLEGGSMHSCLYAVYDFLEQLGMRFYIQEDVFPTKEQEKKICKLNLDYTKKPLFEIRGLLPFHDFPEGPDWWEKENYNRVMMQMTKMKGNFLGYHTYPENEKEPDKMTAEPLVWIGRPEDVGEKGQVKSAYPAQHFRTQGDSWGYHRGKTSEYPFGLGRFFDAEDMAVSYMKNGPEETYQENLAASKTENAEIILEKYQEIFQKSGQFFSEVFQDAHRLGIWNCIGTETPLTIPQALKNQTGEKNTDSRKEKKSFYRGMFQRLEQLYPLDYYWMWTPEEWTWKGNTVQDTEQTIEDVTCALQVKQELGAEFELAMCGWTLGPQEDRAKFDQLLPKEMPFSCINRHLGFDPVDESFRRITGRPKWAAPWLEDDPALLVPQLWVKRIRKDAADAKRYGCDGLIGIHWQTETIGMNIRALMDAAWSQNGWESEKKAESTEEQRQIQKRGEEQNDILAGVEAYVPEAVTKDRILPAGDFYKDFGIHYFGLEKLGDLLCKLDSQLPRPCRWEDGPGNIYQNEMPVFYVEQQYAFVEEWEKAGESIQDADAKERWEIWLARFLFMRNCARLGCYLAVFDKMEKPEELQREAETITETAGDMTADFCNSICSKGDMGNLAALAQRNLIPFQKKINAKLRAAGCRGVEWNRMQVEKIKKRCVSLSDPGYLKEKDIWNVELLSMRGSKEASLWWHPLHGGELREIRLTRSSDFVFRGEIPAETFGESFVYQFALDGEKERKERTILMLS